MTRDFNSDPAFDPRVADWLQADPDRAPAQVLETVMAALPSVSQRRAIRLPHRPASLNRFAYLAAAAAVLAAVVGIASIGGGLINPPPPAPTIAPVVSPSPSPTTSPTPFKPVARNGLIAVGKDDAILLIDPATGKTEKRLETPSPLVTRISWAPDGSQFVFTLVDGVYVMDVSTGTSRKIMACGEGPGGCSVAWSPDGQRIAVTHSQVLELIDPSGDNVTRLHVAYPDTAFHPSWSPDGTRIAISTAVVDRPDIKGQLIAVNSDGSGSTVLIDRDQEHGDPVWSPDGMSIAYIGSTDTRVCRENVVTKLQICDDMWDLHVMLLKLDGSEPRELREAGTCLCIGVGPDVTWSPDGTKLAIVRPDTLVGPGGGGDWGFYVMDADGTDLRRVMEGYVSAPAWQPVP